VAPLTREGRPSAGIKKLVARSGIGVSESAATIARF
jgi:hypothetical protein